MKLVLHGYWRSSPSWRVRIALNWKGLAYDQAPVNLLKHEHLAPAHRALNPQGRVPVLEVDGVALTQGPAILEWIEETAPQPPLLPADALGRAKVRALAAIVSSDITPMHNLGVGHRLETQFHAEPDAVQAWRAHWIAQGLAAMETLVARDGGAFAYGDATTLADINLVTQLYAARRFGVDLAPFPHLLQVEARANALPAFQAAAPERQPDAPKP